MSERTADAFVDRLADRLSSEPGRPAVAVRASVPVGMIGPAPAMAPGRPGPRVPLPAPRVSSSDDVPLDPDGDTDDAESPRSAPRPEVSGLAEPPFLADAAGVDAFAEFESDELRSESTHIEARELLADESTNQLETTEARPMLVVESGPDLGREFVLQPGETGVGRGIDNDIILTDVSVSRKHMRVLRDDDGITVIDLGSGNGTTVNGRRVHRSFLGEGDRVEIGETVMVARIPGAKDSLSQQATRAAPLETDDQNLPSAAHVAPVVPWTPPYPAPAIPAPSRDTLPPPRGTVQLGRSTLLAGAAALVVAASTIGALAMAVLLREEPTRGVVSSPLPSITVASPPSAHVVSAPDGSPSSPVAPPPSGSPPVAPVASAPIPAPSPEAPSAALPPSAAVASAGAAVPPSVAAPSALAAPSAVSAPVREPGGSSGRTSARRGAAREARLPTSTSQGPDVSAVLTAYRRQSFDEAARLAHAQATTASGTARTQLDQIARNIETFGRRWPTARQGRDIAAMEEALRLDRRIAGGDGAFATELVPRLAAAYVQRARSQMASHSTDACGDVRAALALRSSDGDARALLQDCESRATRLLAEAQRLEGSDPTRARVTYGEVVSMLPSGHATARQALARLTAMGRATPHAGPVRLARPVDEDE